MGLVRLMGCVKNYDWGRPGKESRVARLYASNSGDYVHQEKPYAEFWMGTHDSGPSYVVLENGGGETNKLTLKKWIQNNPSVLGHKVVKKWGTNLPFLFKVLSVAKALSIQAHPDKDLAARLHSELPDVYKDDNHKPEMALALTEFEALCGFITLEELKLIVQTVPEIVELVGTARAEQVLELNEDDGKETGKLVLQSVFTELMSANKDVVAEVIAKLISRLHVKNQARELTEKEQVVLRLEKQYPADVGVLAAFLLNYVKLIPGEALYLGANEPHAYMYGDCIECMATSDNVVRKTLTPKHRDVKTLCSMLTYRQGFPEILQGTAVNPHVIRYIPPFDEFEVDQCILPEQSTAEFPAIPGPSIFMVMEGVGTLTTSSNEITREAEHSNFISDYAALLAIKSSLRLEPHNILSKNWSSDTHFCSWYGVSCLDQRVVALQLPNLAIQGRVSSEIANLTQLAVLDLSSNDLNGNLPSELGFLQQLRILNVTGNSLDGTIPLNISRCHLLQELHLSDNMIKGSIPQELGLLSQLRFLRLNDNNLTGKIPSLLGNLSKLEYFYLHENDLEGEIPVEIGHLSNLRLLSFRENDFTGSISASIFNISRLQIVDLSINAFSGELPSELGNYLPILEHLFLDSNRITGKIPVSLSNASKITHLYFSENDLQGNIPSEFGKLHELVWFEFEYNRISGAIPSSLFNISSLEILKARHNYLNGHLPHDLGTWLPNLQEIFLSHNQFSGYLPSAICNASKLENLEVSNNSFTGPIPMMLGNLVDLVTLNLQHNLLENKPGATQLDFLNSLVTSRNLVYLILESNPLNGIFPESIGNLSSNIKVLDAADCGIRGSMPTNIGNLSSLIFLGLANNNLVGNVAPSFVGLQNLERLYLTGNELEGPFPAELCSIGRLGLLHLGENRLSGAVPSCIGNLTELREMSIAANFFSSKLPSSFWRLVKLDGLNLSRNLLHGFFPSDVGALKAMNIMDLSFNKFFGEIPHSTGSLQNLVSLDMSRNAFQGPIPDTFSNLIVLEYLDLSTNALSGVIPKSLELLRDLKYLNVSFNNLQGEVPDKGVFANLNYRFLMGNPRLCGAPDLNIPLCPTQGRKTRSKKSLILKTTVPVAATFLILTALFFTWMIWSRKKSVVGNNRSDPPPRMGHQKITYYELLQATENFSQSNLVGSGSSSTVYQGTFSGGAVFAIKVFNIQWQGGLRNFDSECEILSNIRHRNLVKIVSTCLNVDFIAIVLEYMPNGSLDKRLYSDQNCLSLVERLNIMIDVALAMEYLHHDYTVPIVHCDLKPANVLLDQDLTAHVADFGIAKMLAQEGNMAQTKTLGTIGYIAPEYGLEGQISTSSDVYSFGILLLETFTRKKPTDDMFSGDLSLHKWISLSFPDAVLDILDSDLVSDIGSTRDENQSQIKQLLVLTINVAFQCLKELPEERINMREAVVQLKKIRAKLLTQFSYKI